MSRFYFLYIILCLFMIFIVFVFVIGNCVKKKKRSIIKKVDILDEI